MALMFPRLARNFQKEGYFPTDETSIEGILKAISIDEVAQQSDNDQIRIFDPTCGEGTALREVKHYLLSERPHLNVVAHGIEINSERFLHSRTLLDDVLLADLNDCKIKSGAYSFMLCNPPYGLAVSDKGGTGDQYDSRLEHNLTQLSVKTLATGGVIALVLPRHSFTDRFLAFLGGRFQNIGFYIAGVARFKQLVMFGTKRRQIVYDKTAVPRLRALIEKNLTLEEVAAGQYILPFQPPTTSLSIGEFVQAQIFDPRLLSEILETNTKIGGTNLLDLHFDQAKQGAARYPLTRLGVWHSGLALAAGLLEGVVCSDDGQRKLLVKGMTMKVKETSEALKLNKEGGVTGSVVTATDRFKIIIRAIDITPGSESLGNIIEIS